VRVAPATSCARLLPHGSLAVGCSVRLGRLGRGCPCIVLGMCMGVVWLFHVYFEYQDEHDAFCCDDA
jgi:hypothetical protein